MAALNDEVKAFVVRGLACYDTPSQVVNAVKQKFALDVSRQQVALYDPEKYVGRSLSAKWKTLFFDTRALFRKQVAKSPLQTAPVAFARLGEWRRRPKINVTSHLRCRSLNRLRGKSAICS